MWAGPHCAQVIGSTLLYAVGRQGNTGGLNLDAVGIKADKRGRIAVDEYFQTSTDNIYAAGDVIGAPALASSSMEQGAQRCPFSLRVTLPGRLVAQNMFGNRQMFQSHLFPTGIYTVPEISVVRGGCSVCGVDDAVPDWSVGGGVNCGVRSIRVRGVPLQGPGSWPHRRRLHGHAEGCQ